MSGWGRGGMVGVRKALYEHKRAQQIAAAILAQEHGVVHARGTRADLCARCQDENYQSEQRAQIKRALLTLHRRGYRIRLGRTGKGWFVFINGEDAERDDVHVVRADRLDALANAIGTVELWP